ncbi:MAG: hypothetical protein L6282_14860 [Candidatus Methanoperedenaceae archaeon]|nr:hypothetical protein [Candidatus Methanoperedenaceae archaeon]
MPVVVAVVNELVEMAAHGEEYVTTMSLHNNRIKKDL